MGSAGQIGESKFIIQSPEQKLNEIYVSGKYYKTTKIKHRNEKK